MKIFVHNRPSLLLRSKSIKNYHLNKNDSYFLPCVKFIILYYVVAVYVCLLTHTKYPIIFYHFNNAPNHWYTNIATSRTYNIWGSMKLISALGWEYVGQLMKKFAKWVKLYFSSIEKMMRTTSTSSFNMEAPPPIATFECYRLPPSCVWVLQLHFNLCKKKNLIH